LMRHLPVEATSKFGGFVVRTNVRFNLPSIASNARRNVKHHKPEMSDADVDRVVWKYLDNVGRVMAEFSVLHKLIPTGRVTFCGTEAASVRLGQVPTLALMLHLGNWEVLGPALQMFGVPAATFYEPPPNPVHRRIAEERRQNFDLTLLTPDRRGVHDAIMLLRANGIVAIAPDEARDGKTMAPLFGRPPHDRGNLTIAAKLARRTGAQIVVVYSRRLKNTRFRIHVEEPVELPEDNTGLLDDIAFLNSQIEPIILKNLDQWYYLDDSIAPLA